MALCIPGTEAGPLTKVRPGADHPAILAYDCAVPLKMTEFDARADCKPETRTPGDTSTQWLLTRVTRNTYQGHRCRVTASTESHICGLWSYSKSFKSSTGQIPVELTGDDCARMVRTARFVEPSVHRKVHQIEIPGQTVISTFTQGAEAISESGDVSCQGEPTVVNGKMLQRMVTAVTFLVTVEEEVFVHDTTAKQFYTDRSREQLPCIPSHGSCSTSLHSYAWETATAAHSCPFAYLRTTKGQRVGSTYLSEDEALLLKLGPAMAAPEGCGDLQPSSTQVENLFLSATRGDTRPATAEDVDLAVELRALLFWARDKFKQTEATLAQAADQVLCRAHTWSTKTGEMFQVSPGRFLQRQGDVVYDVTCKEVRVPLREMEQCFREIPIQHEDYKFADPTTRVLVIQGTPRPCLVHYPLKVAGLGNWFTLGPHIKTVSQSDIPKPHYTAPVVMDHDWDQDVGVFTATELEDWAHLASVGHLTQRSAEILATGFCQSEEDCPLQSYQGQSTYSLSALEEKALDAISPVDWTLVMETGKYMCLAGGGAYILSSLLHLVNCIKQYRRRRAATNGARPVPAEEIPL